MKKFDSIAILLLMASSAWGLPNVDRRPVPPRTRRDFNAVDLATGQVKRDFTAAHNGLRTIIYEQSVDGVPVFEGILVTHTTKRGERISTSNRFFPNPGQRKAGQPAVPAAQAVTIAATDVGVALGIPATRLIWLPAEQLTLCWEVIVTTGSATYRLLVDANTGQLWLRQCLTEDYSDVTYRVFTGDSPAPFSPGHSTPVTNQPATVVRSLVTLSAISSNASPAGWIADADNTTLGNNADAHLDRNGDNIADAGSRPPGSPARTFDFAVNLASAPVTSTNASVVNAFYWVNWMHDKLYDLGFTEVAGNFQTDNFSRGGLSNDAVLVDVQDSALGNNANFTTPADGTAPRMQLGIWSGPNPDRDSAFDAEVILHEYTHGLSNRRVGGGVGITQPQGRGMGEGWSDFFALALLSSASDNVNSNYAYGAYSSFQLDGLLENYYFGIRRYPYTPDLTKNPLTFKDIDPFQSVDHPGIPRNAFIGGSGADTHRQGEVWCSMLWQARINLINKHGFATGNQLALQLVCDGLNLTPANPNYTEARDAILQADVVLTGGANQRELWAAFAKRGLGQSATAAAGNANPVGGVETFDVPDDLRVTPLIGGIVLLPGCTNYTLVNTGTSTLNWTATNTQPWLDLFPASGALAAGATTTVAVCINTNGLAPGFYYDSAAFSNLTTGAWQYRHFQLNIQGYAAMPFTENFESGTLGSFWALTGSNSHRTRTTTNFTPHAGNYHLTMDNGAGNTLSRNETTLGINLAGYTNVVLTFWAKSFGDEPHGPPAAPFTGSADFDGVAISTNGTTWWEIQSLRNLTPNVWTQLVVNLNNVPVGYGATCRIRFNQYDNFAVTTMAEPDGIAIDDISLTGALYDTDGDGLPDWWEQTYFVNATTALPGEDSDGDGQTNLQEFLAGTNPQNAGSVLQITGVDGFTITWSCVAGKNYQVLWADALPGAWTEGPEFPAEAGQTTLSYTDPTAGGSGQRFYKIKLVD